jgi:general L-amino acid transport system substrate-binding protein
MYAAVNVIAAKHLEPSVSTGLPFTSICVVVGALGLGAPPANAQINTLDMVRQRGALNCGVNAGLPGFSQSDAKGNWRGLDVDYCKAIAAAVLGDPTKVSYLPMTTKSRFAALHSGEIDVLVRNSTWTSGRDSSLGLSFAGVNYYDGQGFMVKASRGVRSVKELDGAAICALAYTTTELNLASYFKASNMSYKPLMFEKLDEAQRAYLADRCDAYSADMSSLYSTRVEQAKPNDHVVLPEIISKEPLGPSVRQGDSKWFTIVKWVHFALLNAEELGVTHANVDQMADSADPDIRRLLGKDADFGKGLGLDNDFAVKIIKAVGNYGEIFERNVGSGSRLKIARGLNNLWTKGGLQYAPPVR